MDRSELSSEPWEIGEDQLLAAQPKVRALQIQRLEKVWALVEARIQADASGDYPIDPRFLEIGLRALKEEAGLYRLSKPMAAVEEEEDPEVLAIDRAAMVLAALEELEQRNAPKPAPAPTPEGSGA